VKRSKYGAVRTTVDGITFHSKREAARYQELKLLEKAGEIRDLVLQRHWDLCVDDVKIGVYISDFEYKEGKPPDSAWVVEDCKGFRTPLYRWKKKHFEAQHGIEITEI